MRPALLLSIGGLWLGVFLGALAFAQGGFHVERLPRGKSVTIPRPATTYVPVAERVMLTATDMPQTVSFKPINLKSGPASALKLTITEGDSKRSKSVDVSPTTPFLYQFRALSHITVTVDEGGATSRPLDGAALQIESNKPLDIGRH